MPQIIGATVYVIGWLIATRIIYKFAVPVMYYDYEVETNTTKPTKLKPTTWAIWMGFIWPITLLGFIIIWVLEQIRVPKFIVRVFTGRK